MRKHLTMPPLPKMIGNKGLLTWDEVSNFIMIWTGIKPIEGRKLILIQNTPIAFVESDSVKGSYYRLRKILGLWNCSCPSDTFLTTVDYATGKFCKHVSLMKEIQVGGTYDPYDVLFVYAPVVSLIGRVTRRRMDEEFDENETT